MRLHVFPLGAEGGYTARSPRVSAFARGVQRARARARTGVRTGNRLPGRRQNGGRPRPPGEACKQMVSSPTKRVFASHRTRGREMFPGTADNLDNRSCAPGRKSLVGEEKKGGSPVQSCIPGFQLILDQLNLGAREGYLLDGAHPSRARGSIQATGDHNAPNV